MNKMNPEFSENKWYWEVIVRCSSEFEELFSCSVFESGALGIEELEPDNSFVRLLVCFPSTIRNATQSVENIIRIVDVKSRSIVIESIAKKKTENWQSEWKKHFKPIEIGTAFLIRPPWEPVSTDRHQIIIHPGFGFGTGYHESTNLALQLLEWTFRQTSATSVIDVGAGSGILSIASLLLGAENVVAIDIDQPSLDEIPKNLELSGIDKSRCRTLLAQPSQLTMTAPVVTANIEDHILKTIADDLIRLTDNAGYLILSGILIERRDDLISHFLQEMDLIRKSELLEWTGLVLQKTKP